MAFAKKRLLHIVCLDIDRLCLAELPESPVHAERVASAESFNVVM